MEKQQLYIGTYTKDTTSMGIYQLSLDENGKLEYRSACGEGVENPSWLRLGQRFLYAVNELEDTARISAYRIHPVDGSLQYENGIETPGAGMCHLALWPSSGYLGAACYGSGSYVTCALDMEGKLSSFVQERADEGSGPVAGRQDGPHAHSLTPSPSGRFVLGCDLGTDCIMVFKADTDTGHFIPNTVEGCMPVHPGQGPRHLLFSRDGRQVYVICELGNTVQMYDFDEEAGTLCHRQTVHTLPRSFKGENTAAAIAFSPDEHFLYASNRGADTLAAYTVDPIDGNLEPVGQYPCGGKGPRDFAIDATGHFVVVANQITNTVAVLSRDDETGDLGDVVSEIEIPAPVCVVFR